MNKYPLEWKLLSVAIFNSMFLSIDAQPINDEENMINQITGREANESLNGGKTKFITTIEVPIVSIHGNVAVASFVRWWNVYPNGKTPNQSAPTWVTLVLVKDQSDWLISHTHQSPVGGN